MAFIGLVDLSMREDSAVEDERWLLMRSFFWEMRHYVQRKAEEAEDDQ